MSSVATQFRQADRYASGGRRGFTLTELIIVVGLAAILAAVAVPMISGTTESQAIAAAQTIATDLQYAQNRSITSQSPVTVTFGRLSNSYKLTDASGLLIHPMNKKDYEIVFASSGNMEDVQIISAAFGGNPSVTFDVMGAPNDGGVVRIQAGSTTVDIDIADVTGLVTVD